MTPMLLGHAGGMDVHGCSTCGGIWLGVTCAQKFSQELPSEAIELAARHSANATDAVATAPVITCPVCGVMMQRTHAFAAKLDLDFCTEHGTWYDRNEMERIAQTIEDSRWVAKQQVSVDADKLGANISRRKREDDIVDTVVDGAGIAVEVLDSVDTGVDVVGGVVDFFGSLFD